MRVGLDNNILVWLMRSDLPPVDDLGRDIADLQRRARILIAELEGKSFDIVIPAVVVAEFLCGVAEERHGDVIASIHERFFCQPFDAHAAAISAALFRATRSEEGDPSKSKRYLKLDTMVVASAKAAVSTVFYSNDGRCRKLAEKTKMVARDLPTHSEDLFIDLEAREAIQGEQDQ